MAISNRIAKLSNWIEFDYNIFYFVDYYPGKNKAALCRHRPTRRANYYIALHSIQPNVTDSKSLFILQQAYNLHPHLGA